MYNNNFMIKFFCVQTEKCFKKYKNKLSFFCVKLFSNRDKYSNNIPLEQAPCIFFLILVDTFNYALGALRSITSLCTTSINKIVPSIASHARPFTSHFSRHHYCPSPLSTSPPASSEINASADTAAIVCWVFDSRVNEFNPERSRRYRSIRENLDSYCEEGKRDVYR